MLRYKPSTKNMALARTKFGCFVFGLTLWASSISSFGQTASYHDHNIFHGAGTAFVNTSPAAQAVGDGGVLRAQLIWNVMPGQVKGADLDLHAKLPSGNGAYTVTAFDPVGVLPGTPQKTPPFGNPNTASDGNQQVNWVNRQVVFAGGRSVASLDQDNRTGIANSPSGSLVENIYIKGATAASPNNIPSGTYQFAVHNYNQTHLANPQTDYALWITTNGKVGVRSEGHYRGTGQDPANPGLPVYTGSLQNEGQSSNVYEVEIVNPDHDPHAAGVNVIDAKRRYLKDWQAEQALIAARKRAQAELYHQALLEKSRQVPVLDFQACPPPKVCQLDFSAYSAAPAMAWTNPNQAVSAFLGHPYEPKKIDAGAYQQAIQLNTTTENVKTYAWLDNIQTTGDAVSFLAITGYGEVPATFADIGNAGISVVRAIANSYKATGYAIASGVTGRSDLADRAQRINDIAIGQYGDAALSTAGLLPFVGGGMLKQGLQYSDDLVKVAKEATAKIAEGHAFTKHVLGIGANQFDPLFKGLDIRTVQQLQDHAQEVINVAIDDGTAKLLDKGRIIFADIKSSTVLIYDPLHKDAGTIFQTVSDTLEFFNKTK